MFDDENNIDQSAPLSPQQTSTNTTSSPANQLSTSQTGKQTKLTPMEIFLDAVGDDTVPKRNSSSRSNIVEDLYNYRLLVTKFNTRHQPSSQTSIKFWKTFQANLPCLSKLAKQLLCTPATSVASESAFSISAYLARKERARLSDENLSATIFLKVSRMILQFYYPL